MEGAVLDKEGRGAVRNWRIPWIELVLNKKLVVKSESLDLLVTLVNQISSAVGLERLLGWGCPLLRWDKP